MRARSSRWVQVVGLTLAVGGCARSAAVTASAAPAPLSDAPAAPAPAPQEGLPTWNAVLSGHPVGATNPPRPLLVVSREPEACFKQWVGGMVRPDPEAAALGGHVVATAEQGATLGVAVLCPEGEPARLLAAHAAWVAGDRKGE